MTYWHMQMYKERKNDPEKKLLKEKALIGLGEDNKAQIKQFKENMKIGDIVLVRRGAKVFALVEVIGEVEDIGEDNYNRLDWFRYRRKIKVLDWADENMDKFPQLQGNLTRLVNKKTRSYQYIHNWYIKKIQEQYKNRDLKNGSYKLKEFYIENFKMLQKCKINFTDKNENLLPLIIIAGKNGTGKTTLLEYLANCEINKKDYIDIVKIREAEDLEFWDNEDELIVENFRIIDGMKGIKAKRDECKKHIIYLPVEINKIDSIEEAIANYYINIGEAKDLRPSETIKELQDFINKIFTKDFKLSFSISRVDIITRQVFFRNNKNIEISINELSTGEKTLLSKVLYLYFKDIKNQIILIDEPELSLHPAWQNRVLKLYENFAKENNCQIIIATHSPHILGSAKSEYIRLLTENGVVDNFSKSYGLEFSKILTDIMGVNNLRTPAVEKDFKFIKQEIYANKYKNNPKFEKVWKRLEENLESNDIDLDALRHDFELIKKMIFSSKNINKEEFQEAWNRLEKNLGKSDLDLKLLRLEMKFRDK